MYTATFPGNCTFYFGSINTFTQKTSFAWNIRPTFPCEVDINNATLFQIDFFSNQHSFQEKNLCNKGINNTLFKKSIKINAKIGYFAMKSLKKKRMKIFTKLFIFNEMVK